MPDAQLIKDAMRGRYGDFYGRFTELKRVGRDLRGPCPLHGGTDDNFVVRPLTGRWQCYSQCQAKGDAIAFLMRHGGLAFPEAARRLADIAGFHYAPEPVTVPWKGPMTKTDTPLGRAAATYDYTDEGGTVLFQTARYNLPDDRKTFRQRRPDGRGDWEWGLGDVRRVLYRLPAVIEAIKRKETIYIVEGEKDAEALAALGLCATCNPMGAGKWNEEYTEALSGASVVILPDNDKPGSDHAQAVAQALHDKAACVRIVPLPNLREKEDVSDWLAAGGTRQDLETLAGGATEFIPLPLPPGNKDRAGGGLPRRKPVAERVIRARDVGPPPENLPYLFGPYLNLGATHWMTGQTGIGKSTFVYNLAGALAEASELWGLQCRKQRVLYLDMESGDLGRQLKMGRLYPNADPPEDWLFATEPIRLPEELAEFLAYVEAEGVTFVIFDTARRCFTVKDENDNAEVYNRIVPTLDALKHAGVAVLVLGHPPKNGASGARGAGAQEDAGDINLTLTMHRGEVNDPDGVIALRVTKNRLLGHVAPLYLQRVGEDRFERMAEDEASAMEETPTETPTVRVRCGQDILDFLAGCDAPVRHGQIVKEMVSRGYAEGTAKKAISEIQRDGRISHDLKQGYVLPEAA